MNKQLIFSFFFMVSTSQLIGQTPINMNPALDNLFLRVIEVGEREGTNKVSSPIKGTIFLQEDFEEAEVFTADAHYQNVKVKYNILDDVFHFQMGRQEMVLDPKSVLKMVKVKNSVFVVRTFDYKSRVLTGFLQHLVEGKYSLYAKKNIALRPGRPAKALDTEPTPAMYIRPGDTYYVGRPDGSLKKIKNGKDLIEITKSSKLESEAKDQKISLKKEEHLPALVQLVNEMKL